MDSLAIPLWNQPVIINTEESLSEATFTIAACKLAPPLFHSNPQCKMHCGFFWTIGIILQKGTKQRTPITPSMGQERG
tara:strand:+ start:275 stop:508 length:234 start_codon:yes stop_codon:yes gene_type:complete